jgi:CheY-like chemotaxis protein
MKNALVIDDVRMTADTMVRLLKALGYQARAAYGSSAGLAILREETPDIVFVDINMPGVSGLEVLGYIAREPHLAKVAVFVATSDDQPETRRQALSHGARQVLIKPVTVEGLAEALRTLA